MTKLFAVGALITAMLLMSSIVVVASPSVTTVPAEPYREQVISGASSYIHAVWFDPGMGLDTSPTGTFEIRPDEETQTEVGSSRFGGNVAWTRPGEWIQYTVNVEDAGRYRVYAYLAAYPVPPGNVRVYVDNVLVGQSQSTDSSGWQAYRWHLVGEVDLTAGESVIVVYFVTTATEVTSGITNFAALRFNNIGGATVAAVADEATEATADEVTAVVLSPTPPVAITATIGGDDSILRFAVGSTSYSINGVAGTLDAAPFNADGRVMVPLRQIGEAIGATTIAFENNTAIIDDISLPIGVELAGGMGTPVIVDGRTFVPLGYIANAIGATPRWDGAANAAYIYIGTAPAPTQQATPSPAVTDPTPAAADPVPAADPTPAAAPAATADVNWNTLIDLGYVSMHRVGDASYSVLPTGIRVSGRAAPQDGVATNVAQIRASFGDADIAVSGILFGGYEWSAIGGRAAGSMWAAGTGEVQTFTLAAGEAVSPNAGGGGGLWNGDDPSYVVTVRGAYYDLKVTGITVGGQDIFELIAAR